MVAPVYTNFVPPAIDAGNLNEVNGVIYGLLGDGTNPPTNDLDIRTNIGLGNVDNTSDLDKPVSTATAAAIAAGDAAIPVAGRLIGTQTFLANGTYTPTAGTNSIIVEVVGGGGAGGGAVATAAGQQSTGTGGGSGAYTKARVTSGFSGAAVTVGAGGTPVSGGVGGNGGASSFGASITAPGGIGGPVTIASAGPLIVAAGAGGAVGIGGNIFAVAGNYGEPAHMPPVATALPVLTPRGAGGPFGGWTSVQGGGGAAIAGAANTGSGGAAASNNASAAAIAGGAGGSGIVIIYEYS